MNRWIASRVMVCTEAVITADLSGGFDASVDHVPDELQTLGVISGEGLLVVAEVLERRT